MLNSFRRLMVQKQEMWSKTRLFHYLQ